MTTISCARHLGRVLGALLAAIASAGVFAEQRYYETPEQAAQGLIDAAVSADPQALEAVLGPEVDQLWSGDPVADAADREDFVEQAVAAAGIEQQEGIDDVAVLVIGEDDWPFAIPLVRDDKGWRFDTAAGLEEVYKRRIGRNELTAIAVAQGYAEAQREYGAGDRNGDGVPEFAQKLASTPGKRDGLYWPVSEGARQSPMGPLVAQAMAEGYEKSDQGPAPYNGYFFKMLNAQGANANGGARSYVRDGRMVDGFGLIAWPAEYGNSGIMTFVVNQRRIVFEKDLGDQTAQLAGAVTAFDPDTSWKAVID